MKIIFPYDIDQDEQDKRCQEMTKTIREASPSDLEATLAVERAAFGSDIEANLVRDLLNDDSALPSLSLLAFEHDTAIGHILFTRAKFDPVSNLSISIMAPLAIIPEKQKQGIGTQLIQAGLNRLKGSATDLVFVLGYPAYYNRHGFEPAIPHGWHPPYDLPEKDNDAWMVQSLSSSLPSFDGPISKVIAADSLMKPEYWRE